MQQTAKNYAGMPVSALPAEERSAFIWRTYAHVVGAILAFAGIETYLFQSGTAAALSPLFMQNWMLVLGAFIVAGWGASYLAHRLESMAMQYAVFAGFVLLEALIFMPMLYKASLMPNGQGLIESAATVTIVASGGLMAVAMITGKDFSFLRGMLVWGGILALVGIFASLIFGFELGTWFSVAMIGFAGAAILFDTSNILHHYPADRHVGAALSLFASVAMMFWYILRLFMSRD
ncbi:MAG: Bax inhibitor-1 family protein [Pseudomonadota bacterium]